MKLFQALSVLSVAGACASNTADDPALAEEPGADEEQASARSSPPFELVEGEPMYTVLPVDGIPAIEDPVFVALVDAASFMLDDEPVLGVVGVDGTAKCYSAWHLEEHEIVNDQLDGAAIAVTW